MCTYLLRPLTELANCVIVPLAKCVGYWGYDLLCYHKVIKELESVASRLKWAHADIQGAVNAAKCQGQAINEGYIVSVWLREAETLIQQLEEIKLDGTVDSDDKLFLIMCPCTRCCNCGKAQKKMKQAIDLIREAKAFFQPLVGQAQSTHKRSWGGEVLVRGSPTPVIPMIIDDQPEMGENLLP